MIACVFFSIFQIVEKYNNSSCVDDRGYPTLPGSKLVYIHAWIEIAFGLFIVSLFTIAFLFKLIPAGMLCCCPNTLVACKRKFGRNKYA